MPREPGSTLTVRHIAPAHSERLRRAAAVRGMTLAEYLGRLIDLHDAVRARADAGDDGLMAELLARGLESVRA